MQLSNCAKETNCLNSICVFLISCVFLNHPSMKYPNENYDASFIFSHIILVPWTIVCVCVCVWVCVCVCPWRPLQNYIVDPQKAGRSYYILQRCLFHSLCWLWGWQSDINWKLVPPRFEYLKVERISYVNWEDFLGSKMWKLRGFLREHLLKKECFLSGIAWITSPLFPPPHPISGNLYIFFRTSKTTFCAYDRKNTNYHNDGPMIIMMVILMIMITKNYQITYKY